MSNLNSQKFYSNGKLLLTGEYLVLDGALALAIPTRYGQSLMVEPTTDAHLSWESYNQEGSLWFRTMFTIDEGKIIMENHSDHISERLSHIFQAIKNQNPDFLKGQKGLRISTHLDFPREWGLGTSSTLINNMAQWSGTDPFRLLTETFGGSGYDIACAQHNVPITYQLNKHGRTIIERELNFAFEQHLYFVFLNKKQNSRDGIKAYQDNKTITEAIISEISSITNDMLGCNTLETFQFLMETHETIISKVTNQRPVKELLFEDFQGSIKSLGAWGGDFVMVASESDPEAYFQKKGYDTIIPFRDLIL